MSNLFYEYIRIFICIIWWYEYIQIFVRVEIFTNVTLWYKYFSAWKHLAAAFFPITRLVCLFVAIVAFVCLFVAIVSFVCLFVATDPAVVFYFFYMCFRIRLSSPIHLATQRIPILNPPLHFKDKFFAKKSYRFTSPLPLLQKGQEIVFLLLNKHQK